jgi:signal transduction histidine kinase
MLTGLRWRLSWLYALASLSVLALAGSGAYGLLDYYFRSTTDLALQSRLAADLRQLGQPVPDQLQTAEQAWYSNEGRAPAALPTSAPQYTDDDEAEGDEQHNEAEELSHEFDSELASIFSVALTDQGALLMDLGPTATGIAPDLSAIRAALTGGTDWRTLRLADGTRVRLLTYRLEGEPAPAVLQLGRTLGAQDSVRRSLVAGLLGLGVLATLLVGGASWWLAGRSLVPARRAWERQQAFVANASHELRTPLTLVRASAEVARRGLPDNDRRYTQLGDILAECDHMSRLVDDLLLLSRLDAKSLTLRREPVSVAELLAGLQRQVGRVAEAQQVVLEVGPAAGTLVGDPDRVRQVLLALLDNALQHTPAGGSLRVQAAAQGRWIEVKVSDTGSGIAPEHLPSVFERFYRGNSLPGGRGAGLGLAIARGLVTAQGGEIELASQLGQGTTVSVRWPAQSAPCLPAA